MEENKPGGVGYEMTFDRFQKAVGVYPACTPPRVALAIIGNRSEAAVAQAVARAKDHGMNVIVVDHDLVQKEKSNAMLKDINKLIQALPAYEPRRTRRKNQKKGWRRSK